MPDPSNNSFIPKRGPVTRSTRGTFSRRVYVFTLISYVFLFATLLAVGGMYFYTQHLKNQLDAEIVAFNKETNSFSKENMQKVLTFNSRLKQASSRLDKSISVTSIFKALEAATINTVEIEDLTLARVADEKYILTASINTDSFDSTIFQRGEYNRNQTIDQVTISGLQKTVVSEGNDPKQSIVSFTAVLDIPVSSVPYRPVPQTSSSIIIQNPDIQSIESASTEGNTGAAAVVNDETL
ncbi:hypothetical protein GW766_02900 [Candidatus Parcubacteria bacterium]|nr:hypothetical protein [Candidatus Parcubacteria bacterium]